MFSQNSNVVESFNERSSEFYISKLPNLQKRMKIIIAELKMPLSYIITSDFQDKFQHAKNQQSLDSYWIENYKQIVAFMIEGQINTTLMCLSQKFINQFGGNTLFWMDLICSFAQNEKYDQNLRIWQINDTYKNCLHLQKGEYDKNRKFRRLAKNDIQASKKLIQSIESLNKIIQNPENNQSFGDLLKKIQINYSNHENSNKKMVDFLKSETHKDINLNFFQSSELIFGQKRSQSSSMSSSRTKKVQKQKQNKSLKQKMITDFSVNLRQDKNSSLLKKIAGRNQQQSKQQSKWKRQDVDAAFRIISFNNKKLQHLREQFHESKQKKLKRPESSVSNISISYSYLTYINFFISSERQGEFDLSKPFGQYPNINYDNNDYEQFEQIQGEEILESQQMTDDQSLDTVQKQQMLEQSNPYELDEEGMEVFSKALRKDRIFFGKTWIINLPHLNPIQFIENEGTPSKGIITEELVQQFFSQLCTICPCPSNLPFKVQTNKLQDSKKDLQLTEDEIQTLKQIVHMRSYDEIMQIIEQNQSLCVRFPRYKVHKFIGNMTKKIRRKIDGKRVNIYQVLNEKNKQKQEQKQKQMQIPQIKIHEVFDSDQEISFASKVTQLEESNLSENRNIYSKKKSVKSYNKGKVRSDKGDEKPKAMSESLSNKSSLRSYKLNNKEQGQNSIQSQNSNSQATQTLPMRLRQRTSKPVYNINSLMGVKSRKKSKSKNQEEQI